MLLKMLCYVQGYILYEEDLHLVCSSIYKTINALKLCFLIQPIDK